MSALTPSLPPSLVGFWLKIISVYIHLLFSGRLFVVQNSERGWGVVTTKNE